MLWSMDKANAVMKYWRDVILNAPDDLNGWFAFVNVPPVPPFPEAYHLERMCAVVWRHTGLLAEAEAAFKPIREALRPDVDFVGQIPWTALQSLFDPLYPPGLQRYRSTDFFEELSDKAIELHVKYGAQLPTMLSTMHIYPINGAAHRVGANETAWGNRRANFAEVMVSVDADPSNNDAITKWAKDYWAALLSYSTGGGYVNMMMQEGQERIQAAYGDNYARLTQVKAKYDPQNLFRVNQNIKPAS